MGIRRMFVGSLDDVLFLYLEGCKMDWKGWYVRLNDIDHDY